MSKKNFLTIVFFAACLSLGYSQEVRSIDGSNNNIANPSWGATHDHLIRVTPADYIDGISIPKLGDAFNRPNPRIISNSLFAQEGLINNAINLSDYTWVFGQFIDHDLSLVGDDPQEPLTNIVVPDDDQHFMPGTVVPMSRSAAADGTGTDVNNPRNYSNEITTYLDGSMIYGSTDEVAMWLRSGEDGKLKVSDGDLLPWNTIDGEFNTQRIDINAPKMEDATRSLKYFFIAGDARANENPLLLAFHTLFVREHNRICNEILAETPFASDEEVYQKARRKNIAQLQQITFNEWLPSMGIYLPEYSGYNDQLKVGIFNEFSAAAFRFGHTLINSNILRMDNDGNTILRGNTTLKDAFFNPYMVLLSGGIEPFVKGMATQVQQELDCKVIDDVRNFLFERPGSPGLDLASININRGRERGLPPYNTLREHFGLPKVPSFYELTGDQDIADEMARVYQDIDNVDAWVGMLAEKHMEGSMMGRLMQVVISEQFLLLRDGDRFYFENDPAFTQEEIDAIKRVKFSDIVTRNAEIDLMQDEVFKATPHEELDTGPELIPVDLDATINPSVASEYVNLNIFSNTARPITAQIINMHGAIVYEREVYLGAGETVLRIPLNSSMAHGVYNVLLFDEEDYNILKFIKY